jgi:hypothetical protein
MIQHDVLVVLLDPDLHRTPGLSNVDFAAFVEDAVNATYFQAKVILYGARETGNLSKQQA